MKSCFEDKIYILSNGYDGLVLVYQSHLGGNSYFATLNILF